jgi:superoxide dismutase
MTFASLCFFPFLVLIPSSSSSPSDARGTPLLTCDVWEHAYYIDHRNARAKYVETWWKLVNWSFAEENYAKALKSETSKL